MANNVKARRRVSAKARGTTATATATAAARSSSRRPFVLPACCAALLALLLAHGYIALTLSMAGEVEPAAAQWGAVEAGSARL